MKVLVTGATGFIGSHLARLAVNEGHSVQALVGPASDRWRVRDIEDRIQFIESDLRELRVSDTSLALDRPDLCVHLAWRGWSGSLAAVEENVTSLSVGLEFMRLVAELRCPRLIVAGTCLEYDTTYPTLSEGTPVRPGDLYGTCKNAFFQVAQEFSRQAKMEVVWPRIFYSYGPYEDPRRLVPSIVLAVLHGQPAKATGGEQIRDYLHVEDIASAIWTVARTGLTGAVNIASGISVSVGDVIRQIAELMGRPDLVRLGALPYRKGEPMVIRADASLLRERVGWHPQFDLRSGLRRTIEWWRARVSSAVRPSR